MHFLLEEVSATGLSLPLWKLKKKKNKKEKEREREGERKILMAREGRIESEKKIVHVIEYFQQTHSCLQEGMPLDFPQGFRLP